VKTPFVDDPDALRPPARRIEVASTAATSRWTGAGSWKPARVIVKWVARFRAVPRFAFSFDFVAVELHPAANSTATRNAREARFIRSLALLVAGHATTAGG
jgi:hypothetical protein